jgi:putative membrane protein
MLRGQTAIVYTAALALAALTHCKSSNSEPSKTAQSASDPSSREDSASSNSSSSHASAADGSPAQSSSSRSVPNALDDAQIAAITDAANSAEVEQGKLAQSKASDSRVRTFATMMVDHHGEARRDQGALSVGKQDNPDSQRLSDEAETAVQSLQQKSGTDFDRAYIQLQCEEHRKVLNTLEQKLLPAAKDPGLKAYLEKLKPKIEAHLAQAERLQKELGSSEGKSSQSGDLSGAQRALNR